MCRTRVSVRPDVGVRFPFWSMAVIDKLTLLELRMAGFFGVACIRAQTPLVAGEKPTLGTFSRLSLAHERLQRSPWQWLSMVLFMLVLQLQDRLSPGVDHGCARLFDFSCLSCPRIFEIAS